MGYKTIQYLESVDNHRMLFQLDRGESDLPPIVNKTSIAPGSEAISPILGQRWFLDSEYKWQRVNLNHDESQLPPKVESLEIICPDTVGNFCTVRLLYKLIGDNITDDRVDWVLRTTTPNASLTPDGILTVRGFSAYTLLQIKATSRLDPEVSATATIAVNPAIYPTSIITGIQIIPSQAAIERGSSIKFQAIIGGIDTEGAEFNVINGTVSSIDADGLLTVPKEEINTSLVVTATAKADHNFKAFCPVAICNEKPKPTSVIISPTDVDTPLDSYISFAASEPVIWSIYGGSANTYITNTGIAYIAADETQTNISVSATCIFNPEITAHANIAVHPSWEPIDDKPLGIIITPQNVEIHRGCGINLTAIVTGINLKSNKPTLSVLNNTSACTTISDSGYLYVAAEEDAEAVLVVAEYKDVQAVLPVKIIDNLHDSDDDEVCKNPPLTADLITTIDDNNIPAGTLLPKGLTFSEYLAMRHQNAGYPQIILEPITTCYEIGTVNDISVTAIVSRGDTALTRLEFLKDNVVVDTITNLPEAGGRFSYTYSGIQDNTTLTVKVYDAVHHSTVNKNILFVYPVFYGAVSEIIPTEADILSLEKVLVPTKVGQYPYTYTSARACYAYPAIYGALTKISSIGVFEDLRDTFTYTNLFVNGVNYLVYIQKVPCSLDDYTFIFS